MVLILLDGTPDLNTQAPLAFADGPDITSPVVHGRLSKRDLDEEVWQALLGGLRGAARVELTIDGDTRTVSFGKPQALTCL